MCVSRDLVAKAKALDRWSPGDGEGCEVELEVLTAFLRWFMKAASRIPNIAPRVPPMLSTIGSREMRTLGMEPEVVVQIPVSSFVRIAVIGEEGVSWVVCGYMGIWG